ncbi:MAG: hypothetical protein SFV51_28210 [Bryobacteraceae bacterium]|nr:hypothetical protein [Bryobacteraceae bacterium]
MLLMIHLILVLAPVAHGQLIYNARQDQKAEEVRKLTSEIANGQLFQAQLDNLNALSRPASERIFSSARRAALAKLTRTVSWSDIREDLASLEDAVFLNKDSDRMQWESQKQTLEAELKRTKEALAAIRGKEDDVTALASLLKEVALADEAILVAESLIPRDHQKLSPTDLRVIHELNGACARLAEILEGFAQPKPKTASAIAGEMQAELARAEIEHLTNLIKIEARRTAAMDDLRRIYQQAKEGVACVTTGKTTASGPCMRDLPEDREFAGIDLASLEENVETTMHRYTVRARWYYRQNDDAVRLERVAEEGVRRCPDTADRNCQIRTAALSQRQQNREEKEADLSAHKRKLQFVVFALENWAAVISRATTPNRLADLRAAMEDRRYQIKRDTILARGYEMTLLSGAETLAAYHKGGIRPGNVAQLAQAMLTLGLFPAIALK